MPTATKTRRKKLPPLPREIVPVKCADKKVLERWTPKRARDLANIPSPFRAVLVGEPGSGKSSMVKQLLVHQRPHFERMIVCHADARDDDLGTSEYDDCDPTEVLPFIPDMDYFAELCAEDEGAVKTLVVIDDMEWVGASKDQVARVSLLFRYLSTHRGISVIITNQLFFGLPTAVRKTANVFILWKPRVRSEYAILDNRLGLEKGTLQKLFAQFWENQHTSLCFDFTPGTSSPIRLDLFKPIDLYYESGSESE
jgi:hypothetical protein